MRKVYLQGTLVSHFMNEYRDSVIIRMSKKNKRKIVTMEEEVMSSGIGQE